MCEGKGWYTYKDDEGLWISTPCKCGALEREKLQSRMRFANIPRAFADNRFKNFERGRYQDQETINKVCTAVHYWVKNYEKMKSEGLGLYLYSNAKGSGKTRMLASIANELIYDVKVPVKFCTSLQILDEIRAIKERDSEEYSSERQLLDDLQTCEVLMIDDFGTEQIKDWIEERFYSIINYRYVNKKITFFTSNYAINQLQYNSRITNRILEMCYEVPFPEQSIRLSIAEARTLE